MTTDQDISVNVRQRLDALWKRLQERQPDAIMTSLEITTILAAQYDLLDRIEKVGRHVRAVDEAQSMKLCQVREELDRLNEIAATEPPQPDGPSTTPTCESTGGVEHRAAMALMAVENGSRIDDPAWVEEALPGCLERARAVLATFGSTGKC